MDLTIDQLHEISSKMLKTVTEILREENIPYSAVYGTMLGAVRHKGPIPWDADIDLAIPEPVLPDFLSVMERRLPKEYWVDFCQPGLPKLPFPRIGLAGYETKSLHIDFFRMVGLPDKKWKQKLFADVSYLQIGLRCAKEYTYTGKKKILANLIRALTCFRSSDTYADRFDRLCRLYPYDRAAEIGVNTCTDIGSNSFTKDLFHTVPVLYDGFELQIPADYEALLTKMYGNYMEYPPEAERNAVLNAVFHINPLK